MFFSESTGGFYDHAIHGGNIPGDAVEITAEEHAALLAGQSSGLRISSGQDGRPVLVSPPPPTLSERLGQRLVEINASASGLLAALSAAYPDGEVQSWGQQTREAEALAINPDAPAPLLTAIATARGLPLDVLAVRVREKVQAYAVASGQIIGQRQALEDAIHAVDPTAPDAAAQLEAIQWPA